MFLKTINLCEDLGQIKLFFFFFFFFFFYAIYTSKDLDQIKSAAVITVHISDQRLIVAVPSDQHAFNNSYSLVNDLGVTLNSSDIDRSHRVGRITDKRRKDRDIIVKFTSYNARQKLYRQRKELRDSESLNGVFINEDLTRIRSKLLFDARSLVRAKKLLASYSSDGKIFVLDEANKRHVIGTHEELRKFGDPEEARQELAKAKRHSASFASARPCRQDQSV